MNDENRFGITYYFWRIVRKSYVNVSALWRLDSQTESPFPFGWRAGDNTVWSIPGLEILL